MASVPMEKESVPMERPSDLPQAMESNLLQEKE
jgi:hypothetical protein